MNRFACFCGYRHRPARECGEVILLHGLRIVLLCVGASIFYGIVHDQITVRISLEYFTIGHPRIFETDSPSLLGLGWGIIATWWVGLLLGIPMVFVSRAGSNPKLVAWDLVKPLGKLLLLMASIASLAGAVGYFAARGGAVWLIEPMASQVPKEGHVRFLAVLWMHLASYGSGILGGLGLCLWAWRKRKALI